MISNVSASRPFSLTRKVGVSLSTNPIVQTPSAARDYASQRVERIEGLSIEVQYAKERDGEVSAIPAYSLAACGIEVNATVGERFYHRF